MGIAECGKKSLNALSCVVSANGRELAFDSPAELAELKRRFAGRRLLARFEEEKNTRSTRQNKYYWGVVIDMVSKETGYTPEEAHEAMKFKFLSVFDADRQLRRVRSTSSLDTAEMEEYLANIRKWGDEYLKVYIPNPNEAIY